MSPRSKPLQVLFTTSERDLIRREMGMHFGQYPSLADGIFLRTWRGGPQKNQPKIPAAVRTMMDRGLVEVRNTERGPAPSLPKRVLMSSAGFCWMRATWTRRGFRT